MMIPFSSLPSEFRKELTGRSFSLPKGKGASEPFYHDGSGKPVADGTKISTWLLNPRDPLHQSYWVATTAKDAIWARPCVFRIREFSGTPAVQQPTDVWVRIATALERIADLLDDAAATQGMETQRA